MSSKPAKKSRFGTSHLSLEVGYVYVMTNDYIPEILKIGMTTRTPEQRAVELSGTGIPGKWEVRYSIFVPNCEHIEKVVHRSLIEHRVSNDREFFKIDIETAVKIVDEHSSKLIDNFSGWPNLNEVQAYISDEIQRIKRERDEHLIQVNLEKQLWIIGLEQEKRDEEARAIENKRQIKLDEISRIDFRTKSAIKEANFGWGDLFCILVAIAVLVKSEQTPKLHIFLWPGVIIYALIWWHRNHEKKLAIEERKKISPAIEELENKMKS